MDPRKGIPAFMDEYRAARYDYDAGDSPDMYSSDRLAEAVVIAAVQFDHPLARELLDLAVVVGTRILSDAERWNSDWNDGYKEKYRGDLLLAVELARAWRDNDAIDAERFHEVAECLANNAMTIGFWDASEQSQYLSASQVLLIAGDTDAAIELMKVRRRFTAIKRYHQWYLKWLTSGMSRDSFDALFDVVRAPDWVSEDEQRDGIQIDDKYSGLLKLRLALVRWVCIERQPVAGRWSDVLAQIAR